MKFNHLSVFFIIVLSFFGTAQELVYELDFEDQTVGKEITKRNTLRFQGWNKSVWTVEQEEVNKVATSTTQAKVFLIKSFDIWLNGSPDKPPISFIFHESFIGFLYNISLILRKSVPKRLLL